MLRREYQRLAKEVPPERRQQGMAQDGPPVDSVQLRYGYGSIPVNTIFSGMNIHLPAILYKWLNSMVYACLCYNYNYKTYSEWEFINQLITGGDHPVPGGKKDTL